MRKTKWISLGSSLLLAIMLITTVGCSEKSAADQNNLTNNLKSESVEKIESYNEADNLAALNFSLELFKKNLLCDNTLISPLSVLTALNMTANGAEENTLSQMEDVFGLKTEKINQLLHLYMKNLPNESKLKVHMANSIWFKDNGEFQVNEDFLQTIKNYYDAGIYKAPFDETTLKEINDWVSGETDKMIEEILDEIPEDAVMYLINALSFDGEWETIYNENAIREEVFTGDDGTIQRAEMMYSEENLYIEDDGAKGFIKPYAGGKYAFIAMLPPEDLHLSAYTFGLTGEKIQSFIKNAKEIKVETMMPKFTTEFSVEMSDILIMMGIEDAFDENKANFAGLGTADGNLYIGRVIHKTKIEVNEKGTKAGAATVVEVKEESAGIEPAKTVYLDRPFLYLIVDTETYLPLFMGTTLYVE